MHRYHSADQRAGSILSGRPGCTGGGPVAARPGFEINCPLRLIIHPVPLEDGAGKLRVP